MCVCVGVRACACGGQKKAFWIVDTLELELVTGGLEPHDMGAGNFGSLQEDIPITTEPFLQSSIYLEIK
ncbi:hypothetical protein I79_009095 [Cricetulus griseus]|uniref:Uncharacterized protein n=1 Tax=Cricetulus griseus TaxID=10029 RepID=G3HEU8_CRIGR|nr:hypothetical protein I79_009095 [Cricetulus griseus]